MFKTTVKYENPFTEEEVQETLYFNLTKAELLELEAPSEGEPLSQKLAKFSEGEVKASDVLGAFKELVLKAYGQRVGNKFIKNDTIRQEFENSEAYSEVLFGILQDEKEAIRFVTALLPKDVAETVSKQQPDLFGNETNNPLAIASMYQSKENQKKEDNLLTPDNKRDFTEEEIKEFLKNNPGFVS